MSRSIVGKRYNRLTVLKATGKRTKKQEIIYKCKCDCGNIKYTTSARLKNGSVKSCGCYNIETSKEIGIKARQRNDKYYKDGTFLCALDFKKPKANNDSGYTGIHWHNRDKIWEANITLKGKRYYLGRFNNINDAIKIRKTAEDILFKPVLKSEEEPDIGSAKELRDMIYTRLRGDKYGNEKKKTDD